MKLRHFALSALMISMLAASAFAADSGAEAQNQFYRDYMEAYNKSEAANRRLNEIHLGVVLVVLAGMIGVFIIPVRRSTMRSLELNEQQQKTLEEIRDLLKKP